jgi:hypothetical protein
MCNRKGKRLIHNTNRIVIAIASVVAMLIDGVNTANCLYLGSAIVWLFLPECDAVEEQLFEGIKAGKLRLLGNKQATGPLQGLAYNRLSMQKCDTAARFLGSSQG